jgi:hypothetical protein
MQVKAKVVTAFVPLEGNRHFKPEQYHAYANTMQAAIGGTRFRAFRGFPLEECWLYGYLESRGWLDLPPSIPPSPDRYPTPGHFVRSNIVQHNRTRWMCMALDEDPEVDVTIWLDYAILKQGAWTGKPVTPEIIYDFVKNVEDYFAAGATDIPFPGIWPRGDIADHGDNWRFCGSTHIIPRRHLRYVDEFYRLECRRFIERTRSVPLDLPIWAYTEKNSALPFTFYQANHDATQLTAFPRLPAVSTETAFVIP